MKVCEKLNCKAHAPRNGAFCPEHRGSERRPHAAQLMRIQKKLKGRRVRARDIPMAAVGAGMAALSGADNKPDTKMMAGMLMMAMAELKASRKAADTRAKLSADVARSAGLGMLSAWAAENIFTNASKKKGKQDGSDTTD